MDWQLDREIDGGITCSSKLGTAMRDRLLGKVPEIHQVQKLEVRCGFVGVGCCHRI